MVRGDNEGFKTSLEVPSLENIFRMAQKDLNIWVKQNQRLSVFIKQLPKDFFKLNDSLIVARTRTMIEKHLNEKLHFPKKAKPINVYIDPQPFGIGSTFNELMELMNFDMTAYRPAHYMLSPEERKKKEDEKKAKEKAKKNKKSKKASEIIDEENKQDATQDDESRQTFLVKMLYILLVKRLESSWHSFN